MKFPTTVEDAVRILCDVLDQDAQVKIARMPVTELIWLHPTLGALIREEFGLNGSNAALLADTGEGNADDASLAIIHALHRHLTAAPAGLH